MIKKIGSILFVVTILVSMILAASAPAVGATAATAKNVIIMVGDGMGYNAVLAADYYQNGASSSQVYEDFPVKLGVSTYEYESVKNVYPYAYTPPFASENPDYVLYGYDSKLAWTDFKYVQWTDGTPNAAYNNNSTDSSSAATAISTGTKAKDGYVGVNINKVSMPNMVEFAKSLGKSAGVVTSVPLSHATPAGFSVHTDNRNDYAGITRQMLYSSALDVIMGCGAADFNNDGASIPVTAKTAKYIGAETWTDISDGVVKGADANGDGVEDDWTVIRTKDAFVNLASGDTPTRVLGIPEVYESLQYYRSPAYSKADAYAEAFTPNLPNLTEMSKAALNVLDNNENGFFLMIEGGAIDWSGHFAQPGREIEETIDFNNAVAAVVAWIEANGGWDANLLIVTADHETGGVWGPGANPSFAPVVNNGKGVMPGFAYYDDIGGFYWHTNSLVPLYAKGPGADVLVTAATNTDTARGPYIDNTDIIKAVKAAWSASQFMVTGIMFSDANVAPNAPVTVNVLVTNMGNFAGDYDAVLAVNGAAVETKTLTIAAGATEIASFTVTEAKGGAYEVSVGGMTGSFAVEPAPVTTTVTKTTTKTVTETNSTLAMWIGIAGAVIIIVMIILLVRKKK